jgi:hypothetical protein
MNKHREKIRKEELAWLIKKYTPQRSQRSTEKK